MKFDEDLVCRYFTEKFTQDVANYFVIGCNSQVYSKLTNYEVSKEVVLNNLLDRTKKAIDGSPGIYMGCGPWWAIEHNYLFSGIFAYMYIVQKILSYVIGGDSSFEFCKKYKFPILKDSQSEKLFNIIDVLKEASLAPQNVEADAYVAMLNVVIPYMKGITNEFVACWGEKHGVNLFEMIDAHISNLCEWVESIR